MNEARVVGNSAEVVRFADKRFASGGLKDVYAAEDPQQVVALFRDPASAADQALVRRLVAVCRDMRAQVLGSGARLAYWSDFFCWPTKVVTWQGRVGVVMPRIHARYRFQHDNPSHPVAGPRKGAAKDGMYWALPWLRLRDVPPQERGDLRGIITACRSLARALRQMHLSGMAHSDLSWANVLLDPASGSACLIDLDGVAVPNTYDALVVGPVQFQPPEVVQKPGAYASRNVDLHALAVLLYYLLFNRHPLVGKSGKGLDDDAYNRYVYGTHALFVEHPAKRANHYSLDWILKDRQASGLGDDAPYMRPWCDLSAWSHKVLGPQVARCVERAFVEGLHDPARRPAALHWEQALLAAADQLVPCENAACSARWVPALGVTPVGGRRACPACGAAQAQSWVVLRVVRDVPTPEDPAVAVGGAGKSLFAWHARTDIAQNESCPEEAKKTAVAQVRREGAGWVLVNKTLEGLVDPAEGKAVPVGGSLPLAQGQHLRMGSGPTARTLRVEIVG